jgi:hypothetical protein
MPRKKTPKICIYRDMLGVCRETDGFAYSGEACHFTVEHQGECLGVAYSELYTKTPAPVNPLDLFMSKDQPPPPPIAKHEAPQELSEGLYDFEKRMTEELRSMGIRVVVEKRDGKDLLLPKPKRPCGYCGSSEWWWREPVTLYGKYSPGDWVCVMCHPSPDNETNTKTIGEDDIAGKINVSDVTKLPGVIVKVPMPEDF